MSGALGSFYFREALKLQAGYRRCPHESCLFQAICVLMPIMWCDIATGGCIDDGVRCIMTNGFPKSTTMGFGMARRCMPHARASVRMRTRTFCSPHTTGNGTPIGTPTTRKRPRRASRRLHPLTRCCPTRRSGRPTTRCGARVAAAVHVHVAPCGDVCEARMHDSFPCAAHLDGRP